MTLPIQVIVPTQIDIDIPLIKDIVPTHIDIPLSKDIVPPLINSTVPLSSPHSFPLDLSNK